MKKTSTALFYHSPKLPGALIPVLVPPKHIGPGLSPWSQDFSSLEASKSGGAEFPTTAMPSGTSSRFN